MTASSKTESNQSWAISPTKSGRYGRCLNHIPSPPSVGGDVGALKSSPRCAPRSEMESLSTRSSSGRSLNQQYGTVETFSGNGSDVFPARTAISRPSRLLSLQGVTQTWRLGQTNITSNNETPYTPVAGERQVIGSKARMESVLADFNECRSAFRFEPVPRGRRPNSKAASPQKTPETEEMTRLGDLAWRRRIAHCKVPVEPYHTSVNMVLHGAKDLPQPQLTIMAKPSVTGFLTRMSPMEGKLDDRLESAPAYNNAARSVRHHIAARSLKPRSLKCLQSKGVLQADCAAFSNGQGINSSAQESTALGHGALCGTGSTHRQRLQAQSGVSVVSIQPFAGTSHPVRRGPPMLYHRSPWRSSRLSSPTLYLSTEMGADATRLRSSETPIPFSQAKRTPLRTKPRKPLLSINGMTALDTLSPAQASSTRVAHDGLVEVLQCGQHVEGAPEGHASGLRHGQAPSTPVHPVAADDALHMRYTGFSGIHVGSPGSVVVTGKSGCVFHNIHVAG
jgi:hypothetical protein